MGKARSKTERFSLIGETDPGKPPSLRRSPMRHPFKTQR